jgi:predicted RNA binding protein YcfA (HicA-like mRNA interferase family)
MKLPRDLDAAQLTKSLTRLGYCTTRQTGSHIRLQCDFPIHSITVPNHRPLRIGTLAAILADVGAAHDISRDELLRLLFD